MKKLFFGALAALAMVSCSNDQVVDLNRTNDVINYGVVANNATRAAAVYCNENLPASFEVSAEHDGKFYFKGETVTLNGSTWAPTNTHYWPNEGAVKFYAHVNGGSNFQYNTVGEAPKFVDFTVNPAVGSQVDLMYAVKSQAKSANGQVTLNFRHALSQVVFAAKNVSNGLYVEISDITVCNVADTNTFTFPAEGTDNKVGEHNGSNLTIDYNDNTWGKWDNTLTGGDKKYTVEFDKVAVPGDSAVYSLTNNTDESDFSKALILMPQTTTKWDAASKLSETTQSYVLVNCCIYNVADKTAFNPATDVALWGTQTTHKQIAVPIPFNWEQGKKYLYTLVFGNVNGGGGYEPDPDDPEPDPVLVPITYDITVDDFVVVDGGEHNVNY